MKSWMLFFFIDISKNCPVVQLVKLTTLKAAQKYQKADYGTIFARNLSTGILTLKGESVYRRLQNE